MNAYDYDAACILLAEYHEQQEGQRLRTRVPLLRATAKDLLGYMPDLSTITVMVQRGQQLRSRA